MEQGDKTEEALGRANKQNESKNQDICLSEATMPREDRLEGTVGFGMLSVNTSPYLGNDDTTKTL
jgi:hypothetical protein